MKMGQNWSNSISDLHLPVRGHHTVLYFPLVQDDLAFLNGKVAVTTAFTVLDLLPSVLQAFIHPGHNTSAIADWPAKSFVRGCHHQLKSDHIHHHHQHSADSFDDLMLF